MIENIEHEICTTITLQVPMTETEQELIAGKDDFIVHDDRTILFFQQGVYNKKENKIRSVVEGVLGG